MKLKYVIFIIVIVSLYSIPITGILFLSHKETQKYSEDIDFDFSERKIETVYPVERIDISEYYEFDVKVTCIKKNVTLDNKSQILISDGEEFFKETEIAKDKRGKSIVLGTDGIIESIVYGNETTINYYDFAETVFEINVSEEKVGMFAKDTLYSESGENYYVKIVNEDGRYLEDKNVQKGYENDEYVCVSDIDEGILCDGNAYLQSEDINTNSNVIVDEEDNYESFD